MILETGKEPEKLYLQGFSCKPNAFSGSYRLGEYLFCKAENYPTDIRFSLKKKKVKELKERITEKEQGVNIYERLRYPELEGKLKLDFPLSDLISGFLPWRRFLYGLQETALYSLEDFLEEKPLPYPFDQGLSHRKVGEISVNIGTAGGGSSQVYDRDCQYGDDSQQAASSDCGLRDKGSDYYHGAFRG